LQNILERFKKLDYSDKSMSNPAYKTEKAEPKTYDASIMDIAMVQVGESLESIKVGKDMLRKLLPVYLELNAIQISGLLSDRTGTSVRRILNNTIDTLAQE
jgi:hypothetical protein